MKTENKSEELRAAAYDAELELSNTATATWHAAIEYCECARKVFNDSNKDAESNPNDWICYVRDDDWEHYLDAMKYLSAAKNIAQETKVITGVDNK